MPFVIDSSPTIINVAPYRYEPRSQTHVLVCKHRSQVRWPSQRLENLQSSMHAALPDDSGTDDDDGDAFF